MLPRYVEAFVVVGGRREAEQATRLLRFTVDQWTPEPLYELSPVRIQQKATLTCATDPGTRPDLGA